MASSTDSEFREFAHAETSRLLAFAWVLTHDEHDAWDLVQDALIRVERKWSTIRNRNNPAAYSRRVIVNLNLSRLRRLRREVLTPHPVDVPAPAETRPTLSIDWLIDALAALPGRQRAAVTLAYLEDMPIVEIAEILDCSQSAVKTHLARGRDAIRAASPASQVANH